MSSHDVANYDLHAVAEPEALLVAVTTQLTVSVEHEGARS